jgi:colanic acid biosynthesis glycosyl transferase WcaI
MSLTDLSNRMPKTLLLTLVFAPDGVSTATILTELAQQLRGLGHDIVVVTTTPHYNQDSEARQVQPLHPKWGQWLFKSDCQGTPVYHARVQTKGKRIIGRLFDYLSFHIIGTLAGLLLGGAYDIVLAPSPPLTVGLSAILLARARCVPFIYNVQEIYPDIAVSLGVLKNGFLIRLAEWVERFIYARAQVVVVISEKFRLRLLEKGVPSAKLRVVPNFVDVDFVQPRERHNDFSLQWQLENHFVILYAGNIGLTQDLETMIAAAQMLKDVPEVCFLAIGDGARREWLRNQIDAQGLGNVRWLPYQPRSSVPEIYASSDMCLVPLRRNTAQDTFPSKIYTIMAAGRPALVSADPDTELAWVVGQAQCGVVIPPGDPTALANAVRTIYRQRGLLTEMGNRGRQYVVKNHSLQAIARQYHDLLLSATRARS